MDQCLVLGALQGTCQASPAQLEAAGGPLFLKGGDAGALAPLMEGAARGFLGLQGWGEERERCPQPQELPSG